MKLPPKTLHHPRNNITSDDVSELTYMRDEHEYSSSDIILDYNDRASDYDVSSANGSNNSGGGSVTNGGGSASGGGNKKSKNRLTKYLLKKNVIKSSNNKIGGSGSSTNTGGSMGENKNEGGGGRKVVVVRSSTTSSAAAAVVTTVEMNGHQLNNNNASSNHTTSNNTTTTVKNNNTSNNYSQFHYHPTMKSSNNNNTSGQSTTKKSSSSSTTTTVADQMVATMFSQSTTTPPISTTSGVERAKTWKNEAPYYKQQGERRVSIDTSSSQQSRGHNNNMSSRRNHHHDNMETTSSSQHSMEYSSMNVTKDRALGYRSEAVGAAAMVVEFGLNHHAEGGGGVGNNSNNNNNFRERSGSVEGGGEKGGMDMEQRRRTVSGGEVVPPSKSMNNLSDLELLGQTVQCVNAALQSSTTTSTNNNNTGATTSSMDNQDELLPNYHISSFKFNPRGCVWYAALTIANKKIQVPIKVTCHTNDNNKKKESFGGVKSANTTIKTTYTVTISYYEPPSTSTTNWSTTFQDNFPTITNISNNNELTTLWIKSSVEVTESMEWLRRKLRRWISKSMGKRVVVELLPDVIVVLPEETGGGVDRRKFDEDGGDREEEKVDRHRHREEGKTPLKKNLRSVMSADPSTTRTATTASLSSHYSSHHSPVEESDNSDETSRLEEVRAELLGKKNSNDGGGNDERKTTTAAVRQKRLAGQHTMRRLLASDASYDEESEEEKEEEVVTKDSMVRTYRASHDEGNKVANPVETQGRRKSEGELSAEGQQAIGQFREGLMSQNTLRRIIQEETEKDVSQVVEAMKSERRASGEIRVAKAGLMSRKTMLRAKKDPLLSKADMVDLDISDSSRGAAVENEARSKVSSEKLDDSLKSEGDLSASSLQAMSRFREGLISQNTLKRILQEEAEKDTAQVVKAMKAERRASGEIRVAKKGLVSQKTMLEMRNYRSNSEAHTAETRSTGAAARPQRRISQTESLQQTVKSWEDDSHLQAENIDEPDAVEAKVSKEKRRLSSGDVTMMKRGLMSQKTKRFLAEDLYDSEDLGDKEESPKRQMSDRERMMLRQGCASRRSLLSDGFASRGSILSTDSSLGGMNGVPRVPSQIQVSFDDNHRDNEVAEVKKKTKKTVRLSVDDDVEEEDDVDLLVFSKTPLERVQKLDILTEGQYFLGISMLVYMYSHLRETCRMGHTRCSMEDVDTHSVQSQYKGGRNTRYLSDTKTAGSIIRLVIDELDDTDDNDADHEIVGGESKEYERQQTAQFRKWIDDSRISQMDEETEKMMIEMKRKVARHRWKRAISAVRLSYRISGGKPPKWENPVVAPGCENCNRFVDMNEMMNETMRKQPKYFKEGSVMNNLIESGIEVVWFSDLSQNDVVYGICVNREERKIIVVFRGTVNAHNWSMNFKFDTNEYRNPIKVNYPGREDELSLHSGFALYLLRKRKDTGMSKMDEIFEKIEQIGKEVAPDGNYQLCITGHSLGGALATLCGFYCGAKPRFAHLSTIYVWTFAAPRVGTQAFIHAYQQLERTGRIKHARFSCTNDIVPLIPFCNFEYDDLQFYKHVGVRVQLHDTGRVGKWRLRNNLDVTYPLKHDWPSEIRRVAMNNIFANLNTPKGFGEVHGLTEHQRRLHFAMTYRKALGSSELNSDQRRKRIKTLDEYYLIRANIATEGIADEVVDIQKVNKVKEKFSSSKWLVRFLVFLLFSTWILLILSITTDVPLDCVLVPFTMVLHGIKHLVHLPVTLPSAVYHSVMFRTQNAIHSVLVGTRHVGKASFVARNAPPNIDVMRKLAKERVKHNVSRHAKEISESMQDDTSKFQVFERTSTRLYNLASVVDSLASPQLTIATPVEGATLYAQDESESSVDEANGDAEDSAAELEALESKLNPIQEYATGVSFAPKLDSGLYLVGAGVRKKSVVKVYAVAMYSTPKVLANVASSTTLHDAARTFDSTSSMTSFVLEMVYSAGAEKIAGAIGESVKPRHSGDPSDIVKLESLIVEGVNAIGGQAVKGTVFRFDCSGEGVSVSVNGAEQGVAEFKGLGSAFVDVFMDGNSVSPTLIDSCVKTWSSSESKSMAASLVELVSVSHQGDSKEGASQEKADTTAMRKKVESQLKPIQEYATSVVFDPKLDGGLYLVGAGVRKKSVVKVYAVALYGSASVLNAVSSPAALRTAARTFGPSTPSTSFVLEMTYSASAEKIGGAIADSVKPRYSGSASDISVLESLIVEGVNKKGGQASKGTTFRFDCSEEGVTVTVDGSVQGVAGFAGMGGAFVDVFLDDDAVSPTLVSSCMDTWSNPQAKATAASLLELGESSDGASSQEQDNEGSSSSLQNAVESNMKPIQEYATSVTFVPKLEEGLYLAGAGVRKKSIVKVYAVAMYSSPVVLQALSTGSASAMHSAARSFSHDSPLTTFVLEMTYSAGAEKIAGAIAESVKPRYNGNPTDINELEALIVKGVNMKGGQASKGTIFRFDCSQDGVSVSVDGSDQGMAAFEGMGGAFVDVFLDDNAVSPSLIENCVETWSKVSLA